MNAPTIRQVSVQHINNALKKLAQKITVVSEEVKAQQAVTSFVAAPAESSTILAPTNLRLSSGTNDLLINGDGTIISRIKVLWDMADTFGILGYIISYNLTSDISSTDITSVQVPRTDRSYYISPVKDGAQYDVSVRAMNALGEVSAAIKIIGHTVIGKTAAPGEPTSLTGSLKLTGHILSWTNPTDVDFDHIEVYRGTVDDNSLSSKIGEIKGTTYLDVDILYNTTYYYWIKAVDTTGNVSGFNATPGISPSSNVSPPTNLVLSSGTSELLITPDGTIISRIKVSWTAPSQMDISGYIVRYALTSEPTNITSIKIPVSDTTFYISSVKDGVQYDVSVLAVTALGYVSTALTQSGYLVLGKTSPPPDISTFLVTRQSDGTREFTWDTLTKSSVPDLAGYIIKYRLGTGWTWNDLYNLHDGLLVSSPFETNKLAAGTYTAGIKAVDTTGNESTNAKIIQSTLADPRIAGTLLRSNEEQLFWPGTLTNSWITSENILVAKDQKTWADFATDGVTWATWTTWARNPYSTITYQTTTFDIGIIASFTPLVTVTGVGTATIYEQHSDDDITYTSWATVTSDVMSARYIRFKVDMVSSSSTALIQSMVVILSGDEVIDFIEDLDTSTLTGSNRLGIGHVKLPLNKTYALIRNVSVGLQNVGGGWTWEIISKSDLTYGPEIKIYDNTTTLADAVIDAEIKGL